eukprot:COSAG02_NODE_63559_length_263_cov_0.560976_2_plen_60_part_01
MSMEPSHCSFLHRAVRGEWVAARNAGGGLGGETFDFNPHYLLVAEGSGGSICISFYQEDN